MLTRTLIRLSLLAGLMAPVGASALGVGPITVRSALNENFEADIPLIVNNPAELPGLTVQVARQMNFDQAGVERLEFFSKLRFAIETSPGGPNRIKVTSVEPLREPNFNLLLEVVWPRGRLLREFTVQVDPEMYANRRPTPPPLPTRVVRPAVPPVAAAAPPPPAAVNLPPAPAVSFEGGSAYGPTRSGDTLMAIARQVRPSADVSLPQMMSILVAGNPEAFINGNPNALRRGVTLKVPAAQAFGAPNVATTESTAPPPSAAAPEQLTPSPATPVPVPVPDSTTITTSSPPAVSTPVPSTTTTPTPTLTIPPAVSGTSTPPTATPSPVVVPPSSTPEPTPPLIPPTVATTPTAPTPLPSTQPQEILPKETLPQPETPATTGATPSATVPGATPGTVLPAGTTVTSETPAAPPGTSTLPATATTVLTPPAVTPTPPVAAVTPPAAATPPTSAPPKTLITPVVPPEEPGSWMDNPIVWVGSLLLLLALAAIALLPLLRRTARAKPAPAIPAVAPPVVPLAEPVSVKSTVTVVEDEDTAVTQVKVRETRETTFRPIPAAVGGALAEPVVVPKPAVAPPPKLVTELLKEIDFGPAGTPPVFGNGKPGLSLADTRLPDTEPATTPATGKPTESLLNKLSMEAEEPRSRRSQPLVTSELKMEGLDFNFNELDLPKAPTQSADLPPLELKPMAPAPTPKFSNLLPSGIDQPEPPTEPVSSSSIASILAAQTMQERSIDSKRPLVDEANRAESPPPVVEQKFTFSNVAEDLEKQAAGDVLKLDEELHSFGGQPLSIEMPSAELSLQGPGPDALSNYVETKLDLATAYLDMGDQIGARSLLEEVLQEGNVSQKQRAEQLLKKVG